MPLTWFVGVLTLAPAVAAILVALVGRLRPLAPAVLGLAVAGALVPAIFVLLLAPDLTSGQPVFITLFGGATGLNDWFAAVYRLDSLSIYAAAGLALIVTPLLLWMAWQHGSGVSIGAAVADAADPDVADVEPEPSDPPGPLPADATLVPAATPVPFMRREVPTPIWAGLALALAVETESLTLVFADNVLWLALSWVLLALCAWMLGEVGTDLATLDRPGLALSLAGPVLYPLLLLVPAIGASGARTIFPRFTDMAGRGGIAAAHVLVLALVLALAAGAYPFTVWLRRRAALVTPAGIAAAVLVLVPAALYVAARTFSAAQDAASSWPHIGVTRPAITAGIAFVVIGALTVAISGFLALARRDGRALVAFCAAAQAGWGLLAIGIGTPASVLGLTSLFGTATLALAAMLAALYATDALTSDVEPDSAGPRVFGAPGRVVSLAAWVVGAASVLGAPLFAGFAPRQLIAVGALQARGITIPLTGLAWAGDALLALALLRATAPAFALLTARPGDQPDSGSIPADTTPDTTADLAHDAVDDTPPAARHFIQRLTGHVTIRDLVPGVLGLLTLALGIAPQALLALGARAALDELLQANTLRSPATISLLGYSAGAAQWLAPLAWIALLLLAVLFAFALPAGTREPRPLYLEGLAPATGVVAEGGTPVEPGAPANVPPELASLASPAEAWHDLRPAFVSPWTLPGGDQLLRGLDDDVDAPAAAAEDVEDIAADEAAAGGEEPDLLPVASPQAEVDVSAQAPDDGDSSPTLDENGDFIVTPREARKPNRKRPTGKGDSA